MPKAHGNIIALDLSNRTICVQTRRAQLNIYFQRALFARFFKYLQVGNHIHLSYKIRTQQLHYKNRYIAREIKQIILPLRRQRRILYSQIDVKTGIKSFVNTLKTKLFLDLEMSMHPYKPDANFKQEIIQVGYVLVDEKDNIIEEYNTCVKPTIEQKLTPRTLKFLDITQEDINQGITYQIFYQHFKEILKQYHPAIIVWGKNDHLALNESYIINQVASLEPYTRIVNLLMLHKNYLHLKNDLGLINAYHLYGYQMENQRHDAFEDAQMTYKIFQGFKALINQEISIDLTPIQK